MMQKLKVETPVGTLFAAPSGDQQCWPGIVVGIERDGKTAEFVLVEVGNTPVDMGTLCTRVWSMDQFVWCDDPVYEQGITSEEVTEMLEGAVE